MENCTINRSEVAEFVQTVHGAGERDLELKTRPLRGGLDCLGVVHMSARFPVEGERRRQVSFIVKRLPKREAREARIYQQVLNEVRGEIAPSLLWVQQAGQECRLYLEAISSRVRWPWAETEVSSAVLRKLAWLHRSTGLSGEQDLAIQDWNYEEELGARCRRLLEFMEEISWNPELAVIRRSRGAVERVAAALPKWRRQLLAYEPFGRRFIHGDVHPGNVLLKHRRGMRSPVFLDWGRGRFGSPLEDVSSWLQSLRAWEPEARRRHDTLLKSYLEEYGGGGSITRELRDAYWLAAASNYLAGAVLYHLSVAADMGNPSNRRGQALWAAEDCLRVIRRADACVSGSPVSGGAPQAVAMA